MTTYFTADPHFNREGTNVLSRPFASPREMSEEILEGYNSRAGRHDRLIILGDFSFREPGYWRKRLTCKNTILILGNHDNRQKSKQAFGIHNVRETYDTKCKDHPCFCSHYPHAYWPKSHYGSFHLSGHVHDQRTETIEALFPGIRWHDVTVDAAKRVLGKWTCFSEDEIYDILIARPGHDLVEFYEHQRGKYNKDHESSHDD